MTRIRRSPSFIGRTGELSWIEGRFEDAIGGRPSIVLVPGEAGIGKTRLLREARRIAQSRFTFLWLGRAIEHMAIPYGAIADALSSLVETVPPLLPQPALSDSVRMALRELLGESRADSTASRTNGSQHAGDAPTPRLSGWPSDGPTRVDRFRALTRTIVDATRIGPALLSLDDLHWADDASIDLLSHLVYAVAAESEGGPIALTILAAYRPVAESTALARALRLWQREEICSVIELEGLPDEDTHTLVRELGMKRPSPALVTAIQQVSLGNPLFIHEILLHLSRTAERPGRRGAPVPEVGLRLPASVTGSIESRALDLSDECRRVVKVVAVFGDRVSLADVVAVSDVAPNRVRGLFDEAIEKKVLHADRELYDFAHPLIRHSFYEMVPESLRQELHLRIAEYLLRDPTRPHLAQIAHHLASAGTAAHSRDLLCAARRAADDAFRRCAWSEAARFFQVALGAVDRGADASSSKRAELHLLAGQALYRSMDAAACVHQYDQAVQWFEQAGDAEGLARAELDRVRVRTTLLTVPYGTMTDIERLERVLASLDSREEVLRGRILAQLAQVYWTANRLEDGIAFAREALAIGARVRHAGLCGEALQSLGLTLSQSFAVPEALDAYRSAAQYAQEFGDPWVARYSQHRIPFMLTWLGEIDAATPMVETDARESRAQQEWANCSLSIALQITLAALRGEFHTLPALGRQLLLMVERSGYPWGALNGLPALAAGLCATGAWAEAEEAIQKIIEPGVLFAEPGTSVMLLAWAYQQLIRVRSGVGPTERQAIIAALAGISPPAIDDVGALPGYCAVLEIADLVNAPYLADPVLPVLRRARERGVVLSPGWPFLLERILGVGARLAGEIDRAVQLLGGALATAVRAGAVVEIGFTHLELARTLAARAKARDIEAARRHAWEAAAIFGDLGMHPFATRSGNLLEQLGLSRFVSLADHPHVPTADSAFGVSDLLAILSPGAPGQGAPSAPASSGAVAHALRGLGARRTRVAPLGHATPGERRSATGPTTALRFPTVVMMTDMVGSTAMIAQFGEEVSQRAMEEHNRIIRRCLRLHGAREIRFTGDGFLVVGPSARKAMECAADIQRSFLMLNHARETAPPAIEVRIGLAAGEVRPQAEDLFGATVNLAARVCAAAEATEILVTQAVRDAVEKDLLAALVPVADHRFKGFDRPEKLFRFDYRRDGTPAAGEGRED